MTADRSTSWLEIGPGKDVIPGFLRYGHESSPGGVNISGDARELPFSDASFGLVYSSHCIEHLEWFEVADTVAEWARVLAPGGALEVHTVDAGKLMQVLCDWQRVDTMIPAPGPWQDKLVKGRRYEYVAGRLLNYHKKAGGALNLHRALITRPYLEHCMEQAGLHIAVPPKPRGKDHGWINLATRGEKPL